MEFQSIKLDYSDTKSYASFIYKYQRQDPSIAEYIQDFPSVESLIKQSNIKQFSDDKRQALVQEWRKQYAVVPNNARQLEAITLLEKANTFTVTTGHQCGLFAGPLYLIYKIISVINVTKKLNAADPSKQYLPVFWMATEDHDFAEINHIHLLANRIELISEEDGNAVGRIQLKNIEESLHKIEELIQHFPHGRIAIDQLKSAYQSQHDLSLATRLFVHELFKDDGLLIMDADSAGLKKFVKDIFRDDLQNSANTNAAEELTSALLQKGVIAKAQIQARNTNLFLLDSNKRLRIDRVGDGFELKGNPNKFSDSEMLALLDAHPEKFSPNVVLRPLYQETILPNICYIGGGAEVMYWLQIKGVFELHTLEFPILMLRNSALVLERQALEKFKQLGFGFNEIFEVSTELQSRYISKNINAISLDAEVSAIEELFSNLKKKVSEIDKTLVASTDAESSKNITSLRNLEQKVLRAQKRKEETSLSQIEKLRAKYFPEEALQERYDNLLYFYSKYGVEFLSLLKTEFEPLENKFNVLVLD